MFDAVHQWLFLNTLDSVAAVRRLVTFYVQEHNSRIPHSAFRGQTPDEMYYESGDSVSEEIEAGKAVAREERLAANRAMSCHLCSGPSPGAFGFA